MALCLFISEWLVQDTELRLVIQCILSPKTGRVYYGKFSLSSLMSLHRIIRQNYRYFRDSSFSDIFLDI